MSERTSSLPSIQVPEFISLLLRDGLLHDGYGQSTLVLTCTDFLVNSSVLCDLDSEDVLVLHSQANVLPSSCLVSQRVLWTVERLIVSSGIRDVVVCGHSGCKALEEMMTGQAGSALCGPALARKGREEPEDFMVRVARNLRTARARLERVRQNVVTQMRNICSYPAVSRALAHGSLRLHGWVYLEGPGAILSHDRRTGDFIPLADQPHVPVGLERCRQVETAL
jgi:carbonic anhydrase